MSHYSSNPFAATHSDSDSDSASCFITDLFETPSRVCSCDDIDINPFSGVVCDLHHGERVLGLGFGDEIETQNSDSYDGVFDFPVGGGGGDSGGLRVVGFGSDSDSSSEEEGEFGSGRNHDDDDFDVRLCWDSLCLEDHRSLSGWEEVVGEERVNEREEDSSSLVIDEVEVDVGGQSEAEEERDDDALGYLEWEILVAVHNFEMDAVLQHLEQQEDENVVDSYSEFQDGYISTTDYDALFGQFLENESVSKGSPPAAKSFVENLPLVELTEEELRGKDVACAICKDEIVLAEKVRRLPCSHCYHGDCILPWLSIRNTCPVCRFELPTDDPDYEQSKMHRAAHDLLELATHMQF